MEIFFTADTHFDHPSILKHCQRPWHTIGQMNEALIENWNKKVGKRDLVYILGDFAWKNHRKFIQALRGKKVLIKGNHDKMPQISYDQFSEVTPQKDLKIEKRIVVLCHYPMFSWRNSCHGSWHAYGHVHNSPFKHPFLALNVGVDVCGYEPLAWPDLKATFEVKEELINRTGHSDTNPPQQVRGLLQDILEEFRKDEISLQRERLQEMYDLLKPY